MKLILDIGSGDKKLNGSIGLDIRRSKTVDIIADARYLPFKDSVFDLIYSSHLIEHFSHCEINNLIDEWVRVLKNEKTLEIKCPWLTLRALIFVFRPTLKNIHNIYGEQDHEFNYHKCGFSYKLIKKLLEKHNITKIRLVMGGFKWMPFIPSCLHVKGEKNLICDK